MPWQKSEQSEPVLVWVLAWVSAISSFRCFRRRSSQLAPSKLLPDYKSGNRCFPQLSSRGPSTKTSLLEVTKNIDTWVVWCLAG